MGALVRGLTWPLASLLIVGGTHFVAEAVRPELQGSIGAGVVIPIYLVVGAWASNATMRAGGSFPTGLLGAAIIGLMPVMLQLVGFGLILGRDPQQTLTSAVFGFVAILWGGALGSGLTASGLLPKASAGHGPRTA